ncbi:MAG: restriction endonuclease subunit S [Deltaproteobacteria bacterium]|nr:restriction endonuclease subunit S [Deltaproteobacteria bacterium]
MGGEWRELTLGDVIELKRGYDLPQQERRSGRTPIVSSSGITDYHAEAMVKGPGVVTGRYGTLGQVFYIAEDFWPLNTALYVRNFKGNDPRFISYFLRSVDFLAYSDKAAVPGLNRNHLHMARIRFPTDVAEQRAIAYILSALDDKIELNRRMNETLEAMAQALFKSWFVDFDPVRSKTGGQDPGLPKHLADLFPDSFEDSELGEIPKGWMLEALYDCAEYINGLAFRNEDFSPDRLGLPVIKIGELKAGITDQTKFAEASFLPKYRVASGDILFSWSGSPDTSIDTFVWAGGEGWLNQHIFKIQFKRPEEKFFVYFLLRHLKPLFIEIARNKQTTGLGHVTAQDLKRLMTTLPSDNVLKAFNGLAEPLFYRVHANQLESRTLTALRDTLLSKLISGHLRVKDAERFIGRAI